MIVPLALCVLAVVVGSVRIDPETNRLLLLSGPPQIGLWRALAADEAHAQQQQVVFSAPKKDVVYPSYCFEQPVSHFEKGVKGTFCQRYFADARFYKEGGPVFLLDGGETSAEDRLPFLKQGILEILSKANNGLAIVLEHRYYGQSVPVKSFSTDDLRFLNNAEALEDSANFIRTFAPPSQLLNLSSPSILHPENTPWIYIGGSYAGARAAHMRVQYNNLVWGAIASSAVTHAQISYPEYYQPIQQYADESCVSDFQLATSTIDKLLDLPEPVPTLLKGLFGLAELNNGDFANTIQSPIGYWQAQNWDPSINNQGWDMFCTDLTSGGAGSTIGLLKIPATVVNYANYIKANVVSRCPTDPVDCFSSEDDSKFQDTDLSQTWRLWLFQVCTQWGYFMPAPADGPSIVSKYLTLNYTSKICKQAFPPGNRFVVPEWPDVAEVNNRGDYGIEYSRLAFIDGDRDPWRPATPGAVVAPRRNSTVDKPVHLIVDAIHHYDENGLRNHDDEPARIRDVHEFEKLFVSEWISQWKESRRN